MKCFHELLKAGDKEIVFMLHDPFDPLKDSTNYYTLDFLSNLLALHTF